MKEGYKIVLFPPVVMGKAGYFSGRSFVGLQALKSDVVEGLCGCFNVLGCALINAHFRVMFWRCYIAS
jgi:hypothetical protein